MAVQKILLNSSASFKRQLLFLFTASVIVLALTTSFVTAWQTSLELRKSTIKSGIQISNNLANQLILALLTASEENGRDAINNALGFDSVDSISVYKLDHELLTSNSKHDHQINLPSSADIPNETVLIGESEQYWIFAAPISYVDDIDDLDTVEPDAQAAESQLLGYVLLEFNKQELTSIQRSIFVNNGVIGSLIAFFLALIMRWLIARMTMPLSELSKTMETARDNKDFAQAKVEGAFEIRQMATIYNQMMETLERQNLELETHKDNLESEVEIRTQELIVARDSALTASRHKSEFLANISHELRTPLQAIIGYTDLVREDLELECMDAQVDDLNKSIRSANNLLALINNILDLAKIEAGRMDLHIKSVDISQLITETIDTIQPLASTNSNELQIDNRITKHNLYTDRQKLMQIFLNLLSNACKFTKKGLITFALHNDDHYLHFSIKDTGVGIPQDKLQFIFEKFTQVDGSQTRKFEGTGLGMAITKNFCQLMQGKIEVTSEVDIGTTFTVRLPIKLKEKQDKNAYQN